MTAGTLDFTTVRFRDEAGIRRRQVFKYTGPTTYVAGGDPLTPGMIGLGKIEYFPPVSLLKDSGDFLHGVYDYSAQKLVLFTDYTNEFAGDASTFFGWIEVIGR